MFRTSSFRAEGDERLAIFWGLRSFPPRGVSLSEKDANAVPFLLTSMYTCELLQFWMDAHLKRLLLRE